MFVYGIGDHFYDMLVWHPELSRQIERLFDKDPNKIGKKIAGMPVIVESADAIRELPKGTSMVIAAIRYYDEIAEELSGMNDGIRCYNIDDAWCMRMFVKGKVESEKKIYPASVTRLAKKLREAKEG